MTIITSEEQFRERLHRAKLDVVQWRTTSAPFSEIMKEIKERNFTRKINKKDLCII